MLLFFSKIIRLRGRKNGHWHLIVKTECIKIRGHPSPGQIKAYLLGLDRPHTKSVGSCSLVDFRGLSRQKGIRQDQQAFCSAELALSGVEVNNPWDKDRHLLSIRCKSDKIANMHARIQINTDEHNNLCSVTNAFCWHAINFSRLSYHVNTLEEMRVFVLLVNIGHLHPWLDVTWWQTYCVQQQQRLEAFWEATTIFALQLVLGLFKVCMASRFAAAELDSNRERGYNAAVI